MFVDSIEYDTIQNQKSAATTNAKNNKYLEEKTKLENKTKRYFKYYYDLKKKLKYNVLDDQSKIILFTIYQNKNLKEAGIKLGYCKQQIHRKARRIYKLLEKNYFENI